MGRYRDDYKCPKCGSPIPARPQRPKDFEVTRLLDAAETLQVALRQAIAQRDKLVEAVRGLRDELRTPEPILDDALVDTGRMWRETAWRATSDALDGILAEHPPPADAKTGEHDKPRTYPDCTIDCPGCPLTDKLAEAVRKLGNLATTVCDDATKAYERAPHVHKYLGERYTANMFGAAIDKILEDHASPADADKEKP